MNIKKDIGINKLPSTTKLELRLADFSNLADALDYAAQGDTGYNFYQGNNPCATLSYSILRDEARAIARRLCGLGLERGSRVAVVADTDPDFMRFFFACQYAGLVPVPLPAFVNMGGRKTFVAQLRRYIEISGAEIAIAPQAFFDLLTEASNGLNLRFMGTPEAFSKFPDFKISLRPLNGEELAYLQYTSGSTRFPRAVMITQNAIMSNLRGISAHGVKIRRGDRCVSWLPFYHDMGLVGLVLVPMATQMTVDFISPRDFAMRPKQWLRLMTDNRATISFSPPFGYELCARRVRQSDLDGFDLSSWRVAGVGAEMIRPEILEDFAKVFAACKFDKKAFVPSYGMAECSLAVSFTPLDQGVETDRIDRDQLAQCQIAFPLDPEQQANSASVKKFVCCGVPLPEYDIEVRDNRGRVLPERHCGTLFIRGASMMAGYFRDMEKTREVLSEDGWLNTGDIAYRISDKIVITGRQKDMIIINGRNIWPQDLEYLALLEPEVFAGGAAAFSIPDENGSEKPAMLIECQRLDETKYAELIKRITGAILMAHGIDCLIQQAPDNAIPRTTSGKRSRMGARQIFLEQFN